MSEKLLEAEANNKKIKENHEKISSQNEKTFKNI